MRAPPGREGRHRAGGPPSWRACTPSAQRAPPRRAPPRRARAAHAGGEGTDALRVVYAAHVIPRMPPDVKITPLSRTVGTDAEGEVVVDEFLFDFTHTVKMDWMLPGLEPTGARAAAGPRVSRGCVTCVGRRSRRRRPMRLLHCRPQERSAVPENTRQTHPSTNRPCAPLADRTLNP